MKGCLSRGGGTFVLQGVFFGARCQLADGHLAVVATVGQQICLCVGVTGLVVNFLAPEGVHEGLVQLSQNSVICRIVQLAGVGEDFSRTKTF
jgi:hypothetical protein